MKSTFFIGIDIANKDFTVAVYQKTLKSEPLMFENIPNNEKGFKTFFNLLKKNKVDVKLSVFCMEHCGVYAEKLCAFLGNSKCKVSVEDPVRIRRAFSKLQPKTDALDAQRIAQYSFRYYDELKFWKPKTKITEEVQSFLTLREQLVKQSTALKNTITSQNKKHLVCEKAIEIARKALSEIKFSIKEIEKQLKVILEINAETRQKVQLLCSIPGVSNLLASHVLVHTNEFNETLNPKRLSSFLGICPNEYSSGTSVYRKPRSRQFGPSIIRKLLHLASLSLITHNKSFSDYYQRKVLEGKHKMVILNNIKNKLVKIIGAILKTNKPFVDGHISISPQFLRKAA